MKKLSQHLKQALAALAAADAGEMLTRRQMSRHLDQPDPHAAPRKQVALWAGKSTSQEALDYAQSACKRLDAELVVLHGQEMDPIPLRRDLHVATRFFALSGRPESALRHFLASHVLVAFVVLDGRDPTLHALVQRAGDPGVPLVVVGGKSTRDGHAKAIRPAVAPVAAVH